MMPYLKSDQKIGDVGDTLNEHEKELKSQKNITLFFTIIVGITLVATLSGLVSLYINAMKEEKCREAPMENNSYNLINNYINLQDKKINDLSEQNNQFKTDLLILKAKNPSLK